MSKRRVVVTGLGIVSPVGNDTATAWRNIIAGHCGIIAISKFDATAFPSQIAGEVKNYMAEHINPKDARRMDTFIQYGITAAAQAVLDAGLDTFMEHVSPEQAARIGVSVGSGIGGLQLIEDTDTIYRQSGPRKISPFFIPGTIINMISGHVSIMYGFKGPNIAIVTACTTATHAIGDASRLIEYGDADVMVAGGAEAAITQLSVGGFASARALSTRNDDPKTASRPWDQDRDGFVIGEGAGVLVLEEYEHAKKRGSHIYCELAGFGMSGDAYHMTSPSENGEGAQRCMVNALRNAGINQDQVDYINAHGTSTEAGDVAETAAVKQTFQDHARRIAISSTKSMTGHLLGAAGGVEAIFTVLAMRDQIAPPTINLFTPDPRCDLDYVPHQARPMQINVAISNSFGFGGTNGTLVFRKI